MTTLLGMKIWVRPEFRNYVARNSFSATRVATPAQSQSSARLFSSASLQDKDVVVVGMARSAVAKLGGSLSSLSAPRLGSHMIQAALQRSGMDKKYIEEAFMGNVVSAGIGQAPTRQAVIYAGLPLDVPSTTVNKVCASGMKAVMFASLSISAGYRSACIAGGMESMVSLLLYSQISLASDCFSHFAPLPLPVQHPLLSAQCSRRLPPWQPDRRRWSR
jgi:hypothetical protein